MSDLTLPGTDDNRGSGLRASLVEFWHYFSENRGAVIGLYVFVGVCLIALLADVVAPHLPQCPVPRCIAAAARMAGRRRLALRARHRPGRP